MSPAKKKRVYIGLAALIVVIFSVGIFAGYLSRNDKICRDGKPPVSQNGDSTIGQVAYRCHNGQIVTESP